MRLGSRWSGFLSAVQKVMDRHDILRTSVAWEGLDEPVQVVQRHVRMPCTSVTLDPSQGEASDQLRALYDPRRYRIDVREAPLLRAATAFEAAKGRWLLLLMVHHLAADHTTLDLLLEEAQAIARGHEAQLPSPVAFRNFVAQARLGTSREAHERYFRSLLGDVEEPTAPFGLLDVQSDGAHVSESRQLVPPALSARIRVGSRKLGVSSASVMHLAWALVLSRLSGRPEDVVFGTVLFGRMQSGAEAARVLGLFINTLPARVRLSERATVAGLRETQRLLADLLRHEHAPLALAQRCSGVPAGAPLFSALLNYRHSLPPGLDTADAATGNEGSAPDAELLWGEERTNYPLTLSVDDLGEDFFLTVQVTGGIAPERVSAMMATTLESLVRALEEEPDRPLNRLEVLPAPERQRVLVEWNATESEYARERCFHELFESHAKRSPSATAVVFGEERVSYGELDGRANRLAHRLRGLGVGPDVRVGLCQERSVSMVVSLLAVLKAGGAYVPLDPTYPAERLGFMVEDSSPRVLLVDAAGRQALSSASVGCERVQVDGQDAGDARGSEDDGNLCASSIGLTPSHLAYVIYTSGSTGRPKGVMNEHRGLSHLVSAQGALFGVGPESRVLQFASLSFDASVWEVAMALGHGASLHLASRSEAMPGRPLLETLSRHAITHVTLPPSSLSACDEAEGAWTTPTVIVAGEAIGAKDASRWSSRVALYNAYGPTETTVCATVHRCQPGESSVPIGRPIANMRIYILDGQGQPVPVGVTGEIHIAGAGLARGYLNRPELTAERFVADPYSGGAGRMYKTGDLGRWLGNGEVEYQGRNDDQVKVRGFRIELGEVESRLASAPGVTELVVLAREDEPGDRRLVAYYRGESALQTDALRAWGREVLPEYMVPAAYVRLEVMPRTTSGKVDRKALPAPDAGSYSSRDYEAPEGEVEVALAQIWSEVLRREWVGRRDNFFELGGHSLLGVTLVSRIHRALNANVPLSDIFLRPTVAELAASVLEGQSRARPITNLAPLRPSGTSRPIFAVHEGAGMVEYARVLLDHIDSSIPLYGLEASGYRPGETPLNSMEEMSSRYVRAIRTVQPAGPYRIMGYSAGGVIAYAIAEQLVAAGEAVSSLLLVDSFADPEQMPGFVETMGQMATCKGTPLAEALTLQSLMRTSVPQEELSVFDEAARAGDVSSMVGLLKRLGRLSVDEEALLRMVRVLMGVQDALYSYRPSPLSMSATLLRSAERFESDPTLGWDAMLSGGVRTVLIGERTPRSSSIPTSRR